jgi:hypothetical protein
MPTNEHTTTGETFLLGKQPDGFDEVYRAARALEAADAAWQAALDDQQLGARWRAARKELTAANTVVRGRPYPCGKCGGLGYIHGFGHVLNGVCFDCNGTRTQPFRGLSGQVSPKIRAKRVSEQAAKRAAEVAAQAAVAQEQIAQWQAEHPSEYAFLDKRARAVAAGAEPRDEFYTSLYDNLQRRGSLSERQLAALQTSSARFTERAERASKPLAPCPTGRHEVSGRLISTDWKEDNYGGKLVMTVEDDRGFRCWGTAPTDLVSDLDRLLHEQQATSYPDLLRDHPIQVSFSGQLSPSPTDPSFGFIKRPTRSSARLASQPSA